MLFFFNHLLLSSLIEERGSGAASSNSNSVGGIDGGIVGKLTVREDTPKLQPI